jgi:hypothetical protein
MNRLAGIVVAAIGFIVAVLSILKVLPGLTQTGVFLIVLGAIVIGLSFVDKPDSEGTERMSTPGTLLNIFFSPSEVFQNLKRHPRWLVAALIMAIMGGIYSNLFFNRIGPERIANYTIDKTLEMPMIANNEQARKQVEDGRQKAIDDAKSPVVRSGQAVNSFVGVVIWYCILAALFMLFALAMGGKINFWQAFAVGIYASFPIAVLRFVLNTVLLFVKDPTDIHPILGQGSLIQDNLNLLVKSSENPVIYTFLSSLSILGFYWIWMNATGLKNAGERVSGSTAWATTLVLYGIGVLLMMFMAFMFPTFIS